MSLLQAICLLAGLVLCGTLSPSPPPLLLPKTKRIQNMQLVHIWSGLQVLDLAEFLHNRPSDPMCAKALWRRAAARKAGFLQPHMLCSVTSCTVLRVTTRGTKNLRNTIKHSLSLKQGHMVCLYNIELKRGLSTYISKVQKSLEADQTGWHKVYQLSNSLIQEQKSISCQIRIPSAPHRQPVYSFSAGIVSRLCSTMERLSRICSAASSLNLATKPSARSLMLSERTGQRQGSRGLC